VKLGCMGMELRRLHMEFTGERYVPDQQGQIKYEHLHRYVLSLEWAKGKTVLDVASGEGYGAALLAMGAASVVGVDVDFKSVEHARRKYGACKNLWFVSGGCDALPLMDSSIDLVTSFETIEHHSRHKEMLQEIKRVLRPTGVLIISTPNRDTYSGGPQSHNPYHVRELNWDELNALLKQYFQSVDFYGQRLATGSFIYPLFADNIADSYRSYTSEDGISVQGIPSLKSPLYFLAVCSNENRMVQQHDVSSIYMDREVDLFEQYVKVSKWANALSARVADQEQALTAITSSLAWQVVRKCRRIRDRLLPFGTHRHKLYVRCLRWAKDHYKALSSVKPAAKMRQDAPLSTGASRPAYYLGKAFRVWKAQGSVVLFKRVCSQFTGLWQPRRRRYRPAFTIAKSWAPLIFELSTDPVVSIVIPIYNKHLYTFSCLKSILESRPKCSYEVIVVDDSSGDETRVMLQAIQGIRVVRHESNQGFIRGCNGGAAVARGTYVAFLNNDTIVQPNWLDALVETFGLIADAGLVGAKLIYPNGQLQEAGGIIWNDGSGWNYGRHDDPDKPEFCYLREVDYCSGACIMLPKKLFSELGGFDERYAPAYGEDSDLAFKVRQAGKKVLYQPVSEVIHFEGVTSGTQVSHGVKSFQSHNKEKLFDAWAHVLVQHAAPGERLHLEKDRSINKRILIVDACTPTPDQDAGSLKIFNFIKIFQALSYQVTFAPDNLIFLEHYTHDLQRRGVRCLYWPYVKSLENHLRREGEEYDFILSCRPDVTEKYLRSYRKYCPSAKVLYDTGDLHYIRERRQAEIEGNAHLADKADQRRAQEIGLASAVDCTIVVSELEKNLLLEEAPTAKIAVISAVHSICARSKTFEERRDILFLGGYQHLPNVDAVLYFVKDILPILRKKLPGMRFYIVGSKPPESVQQLACEDVIVTGHVPNLDPYMSGCRLSVNPLRYGAGIKGKIVSCMAYGLPCVGTTVAFEGMGLRDGSDVLIADKPAELAEAIVRLYQDERLWLNLSESGYSIVRSNYSFETARKQYEHVFGSFGSQARTRHIPSTYYGTCNVCGARTHFRTLGSDNLRESLLCDACGSSCRNRSLAWGLLRLVGNGQVRSIAELASLKSGPCILDTDGFSPMFKLLKKAEFYASSMYVPERPFGEIIKPKILNVDLQAMTFPDCSYDVILTSDVMEHVRRDYTAHGEIYRCLKPGGYYVFTAPYVPGWESTQVRVDSSGDEDVYLMEKQYHGDPVNSNGILVYRIYGRELFRELKQLGFEVQFFDIPDPQLGILTKDLFVCRKS
jgi:GT2 family glycosyltransferase/ubiquinone/menaquinone biosynthesis C-methylase UbiE